MWKLRKKYLIIVGMTYLICGNQVSSVKNRLKKVVEKLLGNVDEMNYVRFDASTTLIQEIAEEASYIPLGCDHKVVAADNCYFLVKPKARNKLETDQDYEKLINVINNPSDDSDLILVATSLSLDTSSDIYKAIQNKGEIITIADPDAKDWVQGVRSYCLDKAKLNIDNDAISELAERTACDVALLQNSVIKLSLYKDHITYEDVCLMVSRPLEDNSFQLFNYLLNGNNINAVKLFKDLKVTNTEPITLISMLANQFRTLNQVMYLSNKGYSDSEIASELKLNPYRASILKKNSYRISESVLQKTLDDLYQLDKEIKNGSIDRFYALELFLIKFELK